MMIHSKAHFERLAAEQRENTAMVDQITTALKLANHYKDEGKKTGDGAVVAAYDHEFGASRNDLSDNQRLIEDRILREILKLDLQASGISPQQLIARRMDDPCATAAESHLEKMKLRKANHKHHKHTKCAELHHLRDTRPEKPHDFLTNPIARAAHCIAAHAHAAKEMALHSEIQQDTCPDSLH